MNLSEHYSELRMMTESRLAEMFLADTSYSRLFESMRYSLLAGGKRLRPILTMAFCEMTGGSAAEALDAGCAVELIHTYSLIHDDLPCMDDDDLRRGKPTNHIVYGEAMAALAGDALQSAAFSLLASMPVPSETAVRCVRILAEGAGENGMVAGQVMDMESEGKQISRETLEELQRRKTGALFSAACRIGTVLGGGTEEQIQAATEYASHMGLAFQIRDDLLDQIGDETLLGKPIGSDEGNRKSTFVSLLGKEGCINAVAEESCMAIRVLNSGLFAEPAFLSELTQKLADREL